MRLVCDKCGSTYTIEDDLVGSRDFRVSCKQCGAPIVVRGARQVSSLPAPSARALQAPPVVSDASRSFSASGGESWFVSVGSAQQGPYEARELARMLEQERISWATPVWREGMKAWRPARRDALLVTAVAGARGFAGDTMRLSASRSFIASEDTIVDVAPSLLPEAVRAAEEDGLDAAGPEDLSSSNSETKALDTRDMGLSDLGSRPVPAAWDNPQNEAFRAGLLLEDSHELKAAKPAQATLGEAFRSAPSLIRSVQLEATAQVSLGEHADGSQPRLQSFWAVAALAFAGGVLVAALWARLLGPERVPHRSAEAPPVTAVIAQSRPPPEPPPKRPPAAAPEAASSPGSPSTAESRPRAPSDQVALPPQPPTRELPSASELRDAVRSVAGDVRACLGDPRRGVDVDIYFDGPSGRVRDVAVRHPKLSPGRQACVDHAVRRILLEPFSRPEQKLMHRFSW
jgi:predicted Zn finger-like uncharacterized protein